MANSEDKSLNELMDLVEKLDKEHLDLLLMLIDFIDNTYMKFTSDQREKATKEAPESLKELFNIMNEVVVHAEQLDD